MCYIVQTVQDNQGGYFYGVKQLKVSLCQLKYRFKWKESIDELTAQMSMVQVVVLALASWRIQNKKKTFSISVALPKKASASTLTKLLEALKIGVTMA